MEETPLHIFYDSIHVKFLWEKIQTKFQNIILLYIILILSCDVILFTPQAAILGLTNEAKKHNLLNHVLLAFKYYVYRSGEKHILNIDILIDKLIQIKKKEKRISLVSNNKAKTYNRKWCITDNVLLET